MKEVKYRSYDDLPLMLSVPEVAAAMGISRNISGVEKACSCFMGD